MSQLNIIKKTGDTFSAAEFNTIVSAINSTDERLNNKLEAGAAYSKREVDIKLGNLSRGAYLVKRSEHVVIGSFEDNSKSYPLYESFIEITDPLRSAGASSVFTILNEPAEFIYPLGVSLKTAGAESYNNYSIGEVYVENFYTMLTLCCIKDAPEGVVVIRLQYVKFAGQHLSFEISATDNSAFNLSNVQIAPLKYNKKWACSYTIDDSPVEAFSRTFARINKKWMDDNPKCHMDTAHTTGHYPGNFLTSTDGAGNDVRWSFMQAIFSTAGNAYSPEGFIKDESTTSTYITWKELDYMKDLGATISFHNVNNQIYDETDPVSIARGFLDDYNRAFEKTGLRMKVMARPDGNNNYNTASGLSELIYFLRTNGSERIYPKTLTTSLFKKELQGITAASSYADKLAEFANVAASDNPYWAGITTHTPDSDTISFLEQMYSLYGKAGADNVWFAGIEEVFEYLQLKVLSHVKTTQSGNKIIVDLYLPDFDNFHFREISIIADTDIPPDKITVSPADDHIKNITFRAASGSALFNINYNEKAEELAGRYTYKYEHSAKVEDKEDALYFVNRLTLSNRSPFLTRIEAVTDPTPPDDTTLQSISITGGTSLETGESINLSVTYVPSNTTQTGVTWLSSDTSKATVSATGTVTGIAAGSVTITAKSTYNTSIIATINITVVNSSVDPAPSEYKIILAWNPVTSELYPTVDGKTINYFRGQYLTSKDSEVLKLIDGTPAARLIMKKALLPEPESLVEPSMSTSVNPELTGDTGAYPDEYLKQNVGVYSSQANALTLRRITELPAGAYKLRFIVSMKPAAVSDISKQYFTIQGSKFYLRDYPYANNNSIFFDVNPIVVDSTGILDIYCGNDAAWTRSGFNLMEIIKM